MRGKRCSGLVVLQNRIVLILCCNGWQHEEAKVERVKEATMLKLRSVEKQKGDVEKLRDDLK